MFECKKKFFFVSFPFCFFPRAPSDVGTPLGSIATICRLVLIFFFVNLDCVDAHETKRQTPRKKFISVFQPNISRIRCNAPVVLYCVSSTIV